MTGPGSDTPTSSWSPLTGIASSTLVSLATGLAPTEWQLLGARAAQGNGAAMVCPTALAPL